MTTGDGILWATIIILVGIAFYLLSKKGKWLAFGKVMGVVVALCILATAGIYGYLKYQDRPVPQTSMFGVSLKMAPVEVKLVLGEPALEATSTSKTESPYINYLYKDYLGLRYVRFINTDHGYQVYSICDLGVHEAPFGLYSWTTYENVIAKLGEPSKTSIRADGLAKMVTYDNLNVGIEFEKNTVTNVCVTDSDGLSYLEEYKTDVSPQ